MNIAVTGGSGFIGSHVVDKLVDAGHTVRVLDGAKPHRGDVSWQPCDITRLSQVIGALQGCDAVYHLVRWRTSTTSRACRPSRLT